VKTSSRNKLEKWNVHLKTFLFKLSSLFPSFKIDIWYVIFTWQFFCNFLHFFFAKSRETSLNDFPTHFASITQFFGGGKKTADALPTLFLMLSKCERERRRESEKNRERERRETWWKVREMSSGDIDLSKARKNAVVCSRWRKCHIMKPYERKCRLHSWDVKSEKFAESSRRNTEWI